MTVTVFRDAQADPNGGVRYEIPPLGRVCAALPVPMLAIFPPLPDGRGYDPTRLHETFIALVDTHYPVLLGELRDTITAEEDPIYVWQSLEVLAGGAREFVPFVVDSTTTLTTPKAIEETPFSLMPQRDYSRTLLGAKVTLLADGGLVLALDVCHGLMDAQSAFRFLKLWGLLYRRGEEGEEGDDDDEKDEEDIASQVLHDYRLLTPMTTATPPPVMNATTTAAQVEHLGLQPRPRGVSCVRMVQELARRMRETAPAQASDHEGNDVGTPGHRPRAFHLSPAQLQRLKAMATPPSGEYVSSLDATTALFTLLLTQARGHDHPIERVRLTMGVNGRSRFEPPLPSGLCGSIVFTATTIISATEEEKQGHELIGPDQLVTPAHLQRLARRLRDGIRRHDDAYQRATLAQIAAANLIWSPEDPGLGRDSVFATSWVRLGMFDVDFGTRPWFVGPPTFAQGIGGGGMFLLEGRRGAPGIDVVLQHEPAVAKHLEAGWRAACVALGLHEVDEEEPTAP